MLLHSESGRTVVAANEELSRWRRARKHFHVPAEARAGGTLYLYACPHEGYQEPLRASLNGHELALADGSPGLRWRRLELAAGQLRAGENVVELWSDSAALDGWALGIEGVPAGRDSALSTDGGRTWRCERMGIHHNLTGEYLVRLRLPDPAGAEPPPFVWEDPDCPQLRELREIVPAGIQALADPWEKARALASWVSRQWEYRASGGSEYTPWDALTILSWGKRGYGQVKPAPITMCVHFGVVFNSAALALGLPARSVCCTGDVARGWGHFINEVWMERWGKWCHVDANCDLAYVKEGVPLSVGELHAEGEALARWVQPGPGYHALSDYLVGFVRDHLMNGEAFRLWAVWPRNDFFAHPECTPPAHGAGAYCETDWLWARPADAEELGMFPFQVDPGLLMQPPAKVL